MANLPSLQPRLCLGLRTDINGNAQYLTDYDIIYPVGSVLAVHNLHQKRQKFIRFQEKGKNVTEILISPNKKTIAIIESGQKPLITLYCPITFRKKRQLQIPGEYDHITAQKYLTNAISYDSKLIYSILDGPDWQLFTYRLDKGKLENTMFCLNPNGTGTVKKIACNPNDTNLIVLFGKNLIRFMACTDNIWRQFGYSKGDTWNFVAGDWLSQDRILIGTDDGRMLVLQNAELLMVWDVADLPILLFKTKDDAATSVTSLKDTTSRTEIPTTTTTTDDVNVELTSQHVDCIRTFARGFLYVYDNIYIYLYEMITAQRYERRAIYHLSLESSIIERIYYVNVNPAQERLILTTYQHTQIYCAHLWTNQQSTKDKPIRLVEYGFKLHDGAIGDMALCKWKSIVMTAGKYDRTIKIWNYETEIQELNQTFQDNLYGIALHPIGLYALIGFSDKLRYFDITIDEFLLRCEFPIRQCTKCTFSHMGHLFAATNANIIQIYSTITFELFYTLKGHNGHISGLSWTNDDLRLASCGDDGAIYEWLINESKRINEIIMKDHNFTDCMITKSGRSIFVITINGWLYECINGLIQRETKLLENHKLITIKLSQIDQMLFVGDHFGNIFSIKLPLIENVEYLQFDIHANSITKILITYDDRYLITSCLDGTFCIWKLQNIEGKSIILHRDFQPSKDILISRHLLQQKLQQINELQQRLQELETEHTYQLRQNDVLYDLRMKDVHNGYCAAIEELKDKMEQSESEHIQELHHINMDIIKLKMEHEKFIHELEANYNEKLIFEYDKYMKLQDKMERMRLEFLNEIDHLMELKRTNEQTIINEYLDKLQEKEMKYDELTEEIGQKNRTHEQFKQQIEEDADREINELKIVHERKLQIERDLNVRTRGELTIIHKQMNDATRQVDHLKQQIVHTNNQQLKFQQMIIDLEKTIYDLQKDIDERNHTIMDKEKRIIDLKQSNEELEKFRFILSYKIDELKHQIEPKEQMIIEQQETIQKMVGELENLQKINLTTDIRMRELGEKLNAAQSSVRDEIGKNARIKWALKRIRDDIFEASARIQDVPTLKQMVIDMFHKYNADADYAARQAEDAEARHEFGRQRDFLERTVATLQQQVGQKATHLDMDKVRLVDENMALLVETNALRRNLKSCQKRKNRLQSVLGLSGKFVPPKVAEERVVKATATREEIHEQYRHHLVENAKCIEAMQKENERLTGKIVDCLDDDRELTRENYDT